MTKIIMNDCTSSQVQNNDERKVRVDKNIIN